jgi:hypothetical protein
VAVLDSSRPAPRGAVTVCLLGILAAALFLRLWNLDFGLPDWYHPDEPGKARAVARIAGGDLHPGSFYHPSFMLYASAAVLRLSHASDTPPDEQAAVRAGRLTVALLGTATVLLAFIAGRSAGGRLAGLAAALLLAVAPLHAVCSHYLKEDVPVGFWALATYLACLRLGRRGLRRDYLTAGFLAGITAGTKYVGLLFVALPWLAHREWLAANGHRERQKPAGRGGPRLALLAAVAGFFLVTPYALLDVARFAAGIGHGGGNVFTGMAGIAVSPLPYLWTFHLRYSILPGFGVVPTMLALAGFVLALRQPRADLRLLATTAAALYLLFESSPYKPPPNYDRHLVPALPFLALLAATALDRLYRRLDSGRPQRAAWMVAGLILLAAGPPAWNTLRLTAAMRTDTRAAAREWLMRHACSGERVLLEGALTVAGSALPSYVPALPPECNATYVYSLERDPALLAQADVVVATSFMYERFLRFPSAPQSARRFYADFFRIRQPVAELLPSYRSYGFHNPTIRIYRMKSGSTRPEREDALEEVQRATDLPISAALKQGVVVVRDRVRAEAGAEPFAIFESIDLGEGGWARAPARRAKAAVTVLLKRRRRRRSSSIRGPGGMRCPSACGRVAECASGRRAPPRCPFNVPCASGRRAPPRCPFNVPCASGRRAPPRSS